MNKLLRFSYILIHFLFLNTKSFSNQYFKLNPKKKNCKGIQSTKDSILTFFINGLEEENRIEIFFTENNKKTKIIKKDYLQKEIIYIVEFGGIIEICLINLEKRDLYIEVISLQGLNIINKEENREKLLKERDKEVKILKDLNNNLIEITKIKRMKKGINFYKNLLEIIVN